MKISHLGCYPVKSLRGHWLDRATVDPIGLAGDRRWVVVNPAGRFQTQRELPGMATIDVAIDGDGITLSHPDHGAVHVPRPDDRATVTEAVIWRDHVPARMAARDAGAFLSAVLGKPLRLAWLDDPAARSVDPAFGRPGDHVSLADGFPILVTTQASLDDLNTRLERPVEMRRFRPNIVIAGTEPWAEDRWRRIRIGSLDLRIVKPCARCIIITQDPDTGGKTDRSNEPLMTLRQFHRAGDGGIIFGQNAIPDGAGEIAVGDEVEVIEEGTSNV